MPFMLITFIFMAMAAMAIDIGMQTTTRRQMQVAVEHAAIEGLRWRDTLTDEERRVRASQAVAYVYDDDQDISAFNEPHTFGAGPLFRVTGGVGDLDALGKIELGHPSFADSNRVYRERRLYLPTGDNIWLALNLANNDNGDMVAGDYSAGASHLDGFFMGGAWNPYERMDLAPNATGDAFLVRMRRTNDFSNLDREPDVSTAGPTIPFLFGRGSMIQGRDPSATYSPRHHGMTVRATAIANATTARTIGVRGYADPENPLVEIPGAAPFALVFDYWNSLPVVAAPAFSDFLTLDLATGEVSADVGGMIEVVGSAIRFANLVNPANAGDGAILVTTGGGFPASAPFRIRVNQELMLVTAVAANLWTVTRGIDGTVPANHAAESQVILSAALTIGTAMSSIRSDALIRSYTFPTLSPVTLLIPVYETIDIGGTPVDIVVGFGRAAMVSVFDPTDPTFPPAPTGFRLRKLPGILVPRNAAATFSSAWIETVNAELGAPMTDMELTDLLEGDGTPLNPGLIGLNALVDEPVFAPALVRAFGP